MAAEGVSARVAYKFYSSGVIDENTEPDTATDPGATGGQIVRRVSCSLKLAKDTYQSQEVRADQQIADFRHGTRRATGSISGELSPLTYADFFEAVFRGTWEGAVALDQDDLTSLAADNATSTLTFGGGDPVALGLRVGHVIELGSASDEGNNGTNFIVVGFSDASNRTVKVFPAPVTMTADTEFTLATKGARLIVPSTGHVSRKAAIEIYNEDIDLARLFTECRFAGFTVQLPASGMATVEFPVLGRNMKKLEGASAPYFTSPAAETTTGILAAVNGLIIVGGEVIGVITGMNIQMDRNPSSDAVVGQNAVASIPIGRANVTGQITALLKNGTLIGNFLDETEISIISFLTANNDPDAPAMTFLLPRVKFGDADVPTSGEGSQILTIPFQALKHAGAPGIDATTMQIVDTQVDVP